MEKTKLGISVGLLGAAMFLACYFSGYIAAIVLAGYVLLFENNSWLKKSAVKGIALMFGFSLASAIINLIPNAISIVDGIVGIFGGSFYISFIGSIISLIDTVLSILEKLLFIGLSLKALNLGTINVPVIDKMIEKHINEERV